MFRDNGTISVVPHELMEVIKDEVLEAAIGRLWHSRQRESQQLGRGNDSISKADTSWAVKILSNQ